MKSGLLTKIIIMSMIALLCLPFLPAQNAYAAVTYTVDIANTDETFTNLDSFATYAGAYEYFSQQTDMDTVIRDSSGKVYAMKQGMAITYSSDSTLTFTSKHDGNISAYCQNGYACYYVSTDSSQKVTIMISGYKGTCKVSDVILIPAAHMYPRCTSSNRFFVDYYLKDSDGDLRHYLSIYSSSSNSTYTAYITVDKAPSFMTVGEKYYSYDGFTYYTSPYDVVTGSNPAGTHIIYYKWLSYRSETSYTSEELDSFITYKNGSYRTSVQCAYLGLGSTFMEAQTIYGVNAAMELAFANHESAYGKSSFAVNNYNFFGVGAFDSNPSLASKYTDAQIGIIQHAKLYMTRGYMDAYAYIKTSLGTAYYDVPDRTKGYISSYAGDGRYFGSCPGNKAVGICVKYASDPFHGEKVAARMYEIDRYLGFKDYGKYTIGLTNTGAKAYASPHCRQLVSEHGKRLVLCCFHYLPFARPLIIDAAQVEHSVYYNAVQFLHIGGVLLLAIAGHCVETYIYVAVDGIALGIVEGDNVGIVIVAQVLAVDLQYLGIVAKLVAQFSNLVAVSSSHGSQPAGGFPPLDGWKGYVARIIGNHGHSKS